MTLLILAGGLGSRFGGLKQMEPFGPNGEFIIDYSVYDAIKAGFDKVVFVIRESMYEDFKNTIGKRVEGKVKVEYVFQDMQGVPKDISLNRKKPLGTAHAILVAKNVINENFAIINADDFYGYGAYKEAYNYLKNAKENQFGLMGYKLINTLSVNGSAKRGIIYLKDENKVDRIVESSVEMLEDGKIQCVPLDGSDMFFPPLDSLVSMNMILFTPKIFEYLEKDFTEFINNMNDKEKDEFLIPDVLDKHSKKGDITIDLLRTDCKWYGVTHREDTGMVKDAIRDMIERDVYKEDLWS